MEEVAPALVGLLGQDAHDQIVQHTRVRDRLGAVERIGRRIDLGDLIQRFRARGPFGTLAVAQMPPDTLHDHAAGPNGEAALVAIAWQRARQFSPCNLGQVVAIDRAVARPG